ncbi:MAG: MBL fold metallo-hydrolase [Candidatus Aminicenantales bacterium]
MKFLLGIPAMLCVVLVSGLALGTEGSRTSKAAGAPPERTFRFTILYDNYLHQEGTRADWGFSCLIEGTEKTILFDTGTQPQILMHNISVLNVDLKKVELVVISHNHGDHTGGLPAVLERNPNVTVYFPISFPEGFGRRVENLKAKAQTVDKPVEICRNVYLTGEMGDKIKEQSLIVDSPRGLIIVTGCSHQGIVNILERAKEILDKPIYLVFGGFHLGNNSDAELQEIIARFKELKVEKCGATHCTGDKAIGLFRKAFGEGFVPMGTGKVIEISGF